MVKISKRQIRLLSAAAEAEMVKISRRQIRLLSEVAEAEAEAEEQKTTKNETPSRKILLTLKQMQI